MARVATRHAWLILALSLLGCRERAAEPELLDVFQVPGHDIVVSQLNTERVTARDPTTGEIVWEYEPWPIRQPEWGRVPIPTVVCPIQYLALGRILLRFHDSIRVLDAETGELVWRRSWGVRRFCPVAGLDSGVVSITAFGEALEKLDADGEPVWEYSFAEYGAAVTMPTVLYPTGDTLVRTRHHLLNVAPNGALNWAVRHSVELDPEP